MMATTTLNAIRAHLPCEDGWVKLLAHLGKTAPDDAPLTLAIILASNGIDDAIWCLRASDAPDADILHFARLCALDVAHLWDIPPIVREYLETGDESLHEAARAAVDAAARAATRAATWAAEGASEGASAGAATGAAVGAAARDAAWGAAWAAARAAAAGAAKAVQTTRFTKMFCTATIALFTPLVIEDKP